MWLAGRNIHNLDMMFTTLLIPINFLRLILLRSVLSWSVVVILLFPHQEINSRTNKKAKFIDLAFLHHQKDGISKTCSQSLVFGDGCLALGAGGVHLGSTRVNDTIIIPAAANGDFHHLGVQQLDDFLARGADELVVLDDLGSFGFLGFRHSVQENLW